MDRLYRAISPRDVYASAMGADLPAPTFAPSRLRAPTEPPPKRLEPCVELMGYDPVRAKADLKRRHG